ncbi:D-threo-aldose 1-dehydrogenase [Sphingomonas gellani]|uniref:D-threo-aldose 1-dehydrogenase n=1 Tax=Sphingomonas gellani TaxID=1166340 RepID=A0A1H8DXT1_9SPHN|nr:aldo/keto reductase [Sphingomonas gellani]SEN11358.1 D-threo-aldose 1-dehydrogenase [Sphingomonas gellani]
MPPTPSSAWDVNTRRAKLLNRLKQSGPFGFGASSLGNLYDEVSDMAAVEAVDAAWSLGVRCFDTAPFYGYGLSERRLGLSLRHRPRDEYLLSTKAGRLLVPTEHAGTTDGFRSALPFRPVFDYSYDGVMRSVEQSLGRLGLARIDILLLHDLGRATHGADHARYFDQAVSGGFRALAELRDTGVVDAIGLGVNEVEVCAESMRHVDVDLFLIAGRMTLLDQSAHALFDRCHAAGIGIVAAGVFSSGILATGSADAHAHHDYAPASATVRARVAAIEQVCRRHDVPLPAVALAFAALHPAVTQTLVGLRSADQVHRTAALRSMTIPPALWQELHMRDPLAAPLPMACG